MKRLVLLAIAACSAPAPVPVPANRVADRTPPATKKTVTFAVFGEIAIEDGGLVLMDRGNGDKRVHVMTISHDFHGTKKSWDDHPGPQTELRADAFPIDAEERDMIHSWLDPLWLLAPSGRRSFTRAVPNGTDVYEWVIVLRRGAEVRIVDDLGGPPADRDDQPDMLEGVVDFLDMHF